MIFVHFHGYYPCGWIIWQFKNQKLCNLPSAKQFIVISSFTSFNVLCLHDPPERSDDVNKDGLLLKSKRWHGRTWIKIRYEEKQTLTLDRNWPPNKVTIQNTHPTPWTDTSVKLHSWTLWVFRESWRPEWEPGNTLIQNGGRSQ